MIIVYFLIFSLLGLHTLWVYYLAVMHLKVARDRGELIGFVRYPAYFTLGVGLLVDFLMNVIPCSIIFLELPREKTVTSRLKRHINSEGWRSDLAAWFCMNLLNRFDPSGNHCK